LVEQSWPTTTFSEGDRREEQGGLVKKNSTWVWILSAMLLVVPSVLLAQQHQHAPSATEQHEQRPEATSEGMKGCPLEAAISKSLREVEETLESGLATEDPAAIKAALELAHAKLVEAKGYVGKCPMMVHGTHGDVSEHSNEARRGHPDTAR
jgi:hypothetical protein